MKKVNIEAVMTKTQGEKVSGSVYVCSYEYKTAKNGEPFVRGAVRDQKATVEFKVWSENIDAFRAAVAVTRILTISGVIDIWNSAQVIIFDSVQKDIHGYTLGDFLSGCDRRKLELDFYEFLEQVNPKAKQVVNKIIDGEVKERFFTEFAAKSFHDAYPSGLANHTLKMLRLAKTLFDNDERLLPYSDLIYIGIICHDIGKIREFHSGDYAKNSFSTHIEYGCEMIYKIKEHITNLYDEAFFYRLISIIRGHHHIYEEKAKTIYAYIVHLIDMIDSQTTMFMDTLSSHTYKETTNGEKIIKHFDEKYYY
jgi:3'-5' exoribonuclease